MAILMLSPYINSSNFHVKIENLQFDQPFPELMNAYDHMLLCSVELGICQYIQVWFPKVEYRTQSREREYQELFLTAQD